MFFLQAELDELKGEKFSLEERLRLMEAEQAYRLVFFVPFLRKKVSVLDLDPDLYLGFLLKANSDLNPGFL
jgi:hypothetical protein